MSSRHGSASVAILLVLVLFALVIVTMVVGGAGDHDLAARRIEGVRAFYAAEAGVNMALRELVLNSDEDGDGGIGTISNGGSELAPASFVVTIESNDEQATLTSAGRSGPAHRALILTVQLGDGQHEDAVLPGIALRQTTGLWGSNVIDSYDSAAGPYGGQNVGSEAVLASNTTFANGMAMGSAVIIRGEAYCGVGGSPNMVIAPWATPTITGGKHALTEPLEFPTVSAPAGMPPSSGSINLWGANSVTVATDTVYADINMSNNSKMYIDGNVRLRVTGSFNFSGRAAVELRPGATLELYFDNAFALNNDTRINANTADPTRVTVYFIGNGRTLSLNTSAHLHGRVVNPNGNVNLWGDSKVFGTIIGHSLNMGSTAAIHIDTQLLEGGNGQDGGSGIEVLAWGEAAP